jgi:hypothetical protein
MKHDIPDSDAANGDVEELVVGPAVKYAFAGNLFTWLCFPFVIGLCVAIVEQPDCKCGIAAFPSVFKQSFWIIFVIFMSCTILSLACEFCAAMFVLPSQAIPVGGPKRRWMTFNLWIFLMMLLSFFAHIDIFTTGIFMARVWKSAHHCFQMENEWDEIVHNSAFLNALPVLKTMSFCMFTTCIVFIMACQFIYALCYSVPVSPNLAGEFRTTTFWERHFPDYALCDVSDQEYKEALQSYNDKHHHIVHSKQKTDKFGPPSKASLRRKKINQYHTPLKSRSGHGRVVQALADAGRMYTLNWQDDLYLEQAESVWGIDKMCLEMQRTLCRFFLFGVQATMIPYLQVTYIGFQNSCSEASVYNDSDEVKASLLLTVFSAILALATGANYMFYELSSLSKHWVQLRVARQRVHSMHSVDVGHRQLTRADWWEPQRQARMALRVLIVGFIMGFIFTCLYLYILVKATMLILICPAHFPGQHIAG